MRPEALDRIKLIFRLFDADGSGRLEAADFDLMTRNVIAAAPAASDAAQAELADAFGQFWTTLARELDADGDGKVSFAEFQDCVFSPERFDRTIATFAEALAAMGDPDGDGLIERPVFTALMTAIGFGADNIAKLFDAFGPDRQDRITVRIWVQGIKDYYAPEKAGVAGDHLVPSA
ncbi:EF-hand domain-containing protein [Amycolatopsis sp. PS_44_ISF1]|uniref:EF-hand domain-containing protein n=1 Tax=Amycolatopsis sp. PS_44_ISF1 TaxID=2974917 RepID=UPI0028DD5071|nr:EF-hand domain-containing protein [Amycolatopsis sp. PS_44_ISF1]MDT8913224.1 EF-hand domain-containing protein [Amycolatopsis sp. PS_44_ISF1]